MGEAKRKIERLRATFLADAEKWLFPPSEWEARTIEEVRQLPMHTVRRVVGAEAQVSGMPPRECHANCRWYEKNDPEGKSRQVTGWWHQDGNYVLHSVVARDGGMIDITPSEVHGPLVDFVPDPKIEWREQGDRLAPYREGVRVPVGIRSDPAAALEEVEQVKKRLLSGMNPLKAVTAATVTALDGDGRK